MDDLRKEWAARLASDEQSGISEWAQRIGNKLFSENPHRAQEAATLAIDHCFERKSVVPERTLFAEAIRRSLGEAKAETVERIVRSKNLILAERKGRRFATTAEVLAQEKRMIDFARMVVARVPDWEKPIAHSIGSGSTKGRSARSPTF